MKKLLIIFLFFGVSALALFAYPSFLTLGQSNLSKDIASPLPEFLTKTFPKVLGSSTSFWKPSKFLPIQPSPKEIDLTAKSVLSYDITTDKVLYAKNPDTRLPMASLTKIMTAILALENYDLDRKLTVSENAAEVGEGTMGLVSGETLAMEDLLYGMLMQSGNDASETIAQGSDFGRENFVYLMNKKAEDLGLTNTHYTNPSGLEGDGQQYSTAFDLLIQTRFALENPKFAQIVSTYDYDIPATDQHSEYHLYNETNLLTTYPGVKGVKTGYTYEAGLCLITYLEYDGHKIIAVLLNAQNRRQEMKDLLDYSLKSLGVKPPAHE